MLVNLQHMLQAITYYISIPFLYLISAVPDFVLYAVSDSVFFILYHVVGYRRKVVRQNLLNAFPTSTETEINLLEKKFYHHLCDLILETFRTLTRGEKFFIQHCSFTHQSKLLFEDFAHRNQSFIIVMGHCGNWEWAGNSVSIEAQHKLQVIYHPISNYFFNRMMIGMRTRFGTRLIKMKSAFAELKLHAPELTATAFIADQTPPPANAYWTIFLNQQTPVFKGTELLAKKLNLPVVFATVKKIKRGYYEMNTEVICSYPSQTNTNEISELHTRKLEIEILKQPETWLWSHKRWKHKPADINPAKAG